MKNFKLPFNKALDSVSYEQLEQLRSFDNLKSIKPSASQIMKRMDQELFEEMLEALELGEEVTLI